MKSFRKVTAIICAAACATMPFAFTACGENEQPANGGVTASQWKEMIRNTLTLTKQASMFPIVFGQL